MSDRDEPQERRLAALILAAGMSQRMGSAKLLIRDGSGKSLLFRAIAAVRDAGFEPLIVVRAEDQEVSAEARRAGARTIGVPDAAEGMAASIRAGIAKVDADASAAGVLITLGDQWRIQAGDLRALRRAWQANVLGIAAARYDGVLGAPAIFSREHFGMLRSLTGDHGARDYLRAHAGEVAAVDIHSAAADVDVPADLDAGR